MRRLTMASAWVLGCLGRDEGLVESDPPVPPASLGALTEYVRMHGGSVFVGALDSPLRSVAPERIGVGEDLFIEYPRGAASARVIDALGETLPTTLTLEGASGQRRLTDADGAPSDTQLVTQPTATTRMLLDDRARQVFFVFPHARVSTPGNLFVYWRASLRDDGTVSGEGTTANAAVALTTLQRP